jgi:protein-disulfide isomerase
MPGRRAALTILALVGILLGCACQPQPGSEGGRGPAAEHAALFRELPEIDIESLTTSEQRQLAQLLEEEEAPCVGQSIRVADCILSHKSCAACRGASRFMADQVRRGKTLEQVRAGYEARFAAARVSTIDTAGAPLKGNADAPVQIVEFADFECPACRTMALLLSEVVARYHGKVSLVFKHYPLSYHKDAAYAARVAVAAHNQGKFWPVHDRLYDYRPLGPRSLERLGQEVGLDVPRLLSDIESEASQARVHEDRKQGEKLRLRGTPTLFINGRRFDASVMELTEWIDLELSLANGPEGAG